MFKLPKLTKPRQKINVLIAALFIAVQLPMALLASSVVRADGDGSPDACLNTTTNVLGSQGGSDNSGSEDLVIVSVENDEIVSGVCIKSGQNMFGGNKHSSVLGNGTYEDSCYTVSGVGTQTVTVTRIGDGNDCQGISHIDVVFEEKEEPRTGSVKIVKDVKDGTDPQDFTFTGGPTSDPDQVSFPLDDDNDQTLKDYRDFPSLAPGEYTVTETAILGWDVSVSCTDTEEDVTNDGRTATFTLEAGDEVVCTFVNDKEEGQQEPETGSITIVKDARPNDAMNFIFSVTGDGVSDFELDDDGETSILSNSKLHDNLPAGEYSFTETEVEGWTLESITCSTTEGVVVTSPKVTITLGEGDDVTCTFVNVLDEEEGNVLGETTTTGGQVLAAQVVAPVGGVGAGAAAGSITGSLVGLGTSLMTLGYGVVSLRKKQ